MLAMLSAGPVSAANGADDSLTGAQFASCKTAADQPICLFRLAARSKIHQSFRENIAIGYAPAVLAAIGPDPADDLSDPVRKILHQPYKAAAMQALIADHSGAPPAKALEAVRAIPVTVAREPADQLDEQQRAAWQRTQAYAELWSAGHGDKALPPAHRPSATLARAILEAWRADLLQSGDHGDAQALADAYRESGDIASADAVEPKTAADETRRLIDDGRFADAIVALDRMRSRPEQTPAAASAAEAKLLATMSRYFLAEMEGSLIRKAVAAGKVEVAVSVAEKALKRWLDTAVEGGPEAAVAMRVASNMVLIADKAPRARALAWAERMDAAARVKTSPTAAINALAAMRAWAKLGERSRVDALMAFWAKDVRDALARCDMSVLKTCLPRPALFIPISLKEQPLNTPWDELAPRSDGFFGQSVMVAGGVAGIEARLADLSAPWERLGTLFSCASIATEANDVALAVHCAHRLAAEPLTPAEMVLPGMPPLRPERINSVLRVARLAARQGDAKAFDDMLAVAFDLATRDPEEDVDPAPLLEDIAIAELRQQGRL